MLRPRWRKVFKDLWENRSRTILVVLSIAVGVFAIGVIAGSFSMIRSDLNTSYSSANPANILVITDLFDQGLVDSVRNMDSVAEAEGRRLLDVRLQTATGEWDSITLEAIPDGKVPTINQLIPLEGEVIPSSRSVVLERKTARDLALDMGDTIEIELDDGTTLSLVVSGVAQEVTAGYGAILGDNKGYVSADDLDWLHQPSAYNRLYVTVAEGSNDKVQIQYVTEQVIDRLEDTGRQIYWSSQSLSNEHPISSIIEALLSILGILGILVVFLSGSLIANTMSGLLSQHTRQIGVMKLVGARRSQVITMYMVLIEAFGFIALLIALPGSLTGAHWLARMVADIINFKLSPFRVAPMAIALQVAVALLAPPLAGLAPVLAGASVTVQKALTSTGLGDPKKRKSGLGARIGRIKGLSRPLLISLRNTFRRKARLALTLITLILGGAIYISVFNTQAALDTKVEQAGQYFRADVNLDFGQSYRIEEVTQVAMSVPGVERVEVWTTVSVDMQMEDGSPAKGIKVMAPPVDSDLVSPTLLEGRWLVAEDERAIAVNDAFWDDLPDLAVGDSLRLKVAGRVEDWTVVGIYQYTGIDELFAYANYDYLAKELNQIGRASVYRIVTEEHDAAFQEDVRTALERRFTDMGFRVSKVEAGHSFVSSISNVLGILTTVLLVMALLTAMVGSIGLAGAMSMNVLERTREIGVLRSIGAYNGIVGKLVIVEGLVIGIISYAVAVLVSFPITSLLSNVISVAIFNSPAKMTLTATGFLSWLGLVAVLSVVASLVPARNATRLTIREVLAYE